MMNSKENYHKIVSLFIVIIASTIFFRSLCTILIILFALYNLLHFKFLKWPKHAYKFIILLALPLVFEILFFWNNSSISLGFKSLEKYISLFIFPLFILGNYQSISFYRILNQYRIIQTLILLVLLLRFTIVDFHLVSKYLNGIDLWEIGYKFANSFKNHAPAVNMHVAFLVVTNVYFLLKKQTLKIRIINVFLLSIAILALLVLNTRISLFMSLLCIFIVVLNVFYTKYNLTQLLKIAGICFVLIAGLLFISFKANPYMKEKYFKVTFEYMDKVGKLDEIEKPEEKVFNAFVTRVSIWKSAYELALEKPIIGFGSADGKKEVVKYFERTNQKFLAKFEFPVHNQLLDFFVKFGILGVLMGLLYLTIPIVTGFKTKNVVLFCFGMIFFISNLFDDFLIRFDGIIFFGIWSCLGMVYYLNNKSYAV